MNAEDNFMKTGVYQHFKGGLYVVEAIAKHSETLEEYVVYRNDNGETWIRPKNMFFEEVNKDGYNGPQFTLLREVNIGRMSPIELIR